MSKPRRQYGEREKAAALAYLDACGGNQNKTARDFGVPRATLQRWIAGQGIAGDVPQLRQVEKGNLADRLESLAHQLIDAAPGKIPDAALSQVSMSLGIAVDKMRLLREQPTSITAALSDEERAARIEALAERVKLRMVAGGSK